MVVLTDAPTMVIDENIKYRYTYNFLPITVSQ